MTATVADRPVPSPPGQVVELSTTPRQRCLHWCEGHHQIHTEDWRPTEEESWGAGPEEYLPPHPSDCTCWRCARPVRRHVF